MLAKTFTLFLLGAALSACAPTPAQVPQPVGTPAALPPRDRLIAAVEAEGCVYSRDTSGAVLLRANLTQAEAVPILLQLGAEGRAEPGGTTGAETIRLLSDNCI